MAITAYDYCAIVSACLLLSICIIGQFQQRNNALSRLRHHTEVASILEIARPYEEQSKVEQIQTRILERVMTAEKVTVQQLRGGNEDARERCTERLFKESMDYNDLERMTRLMVVELKEGWQMEDESEDADVVEKGRQSVGE